MLVQQVLLFLLMFWVHVLQENPLKHFFQDPKNPTLTQRRHFEQFNCLNWRFYFFLEFAVLAPPAKWRFKPWKSFRKGRHAPRFRKVRKTSEKEKWRDPFSVASNSGKNTKHFRNHKLYKSWNTCLSCQSKSFCEFVWDFLRLFNFNTFYYFLKTLWKMWYGKWRKEAW